MVDYEIVTNSGCVINVSDYCFRFLKKTTEVSTPESISAYFNGRSLFDSDEYCDDGYHDYDDRSDELCKHLESGYCTISYDVPVTRGTPICNFLVKITQEVPWIKEITTFDVDSRKVTVTSAPGDQMFQVLNTFRNFTYIFQGNFSEFLDEVGERFTASQIFNLWKVATFSRSIHTKKFSAYLTDPSNDYCWAACDGVTLNQLHQMLLAEPVWKQEVGILDDGEHNLCACFEIPDDASVSGPYSNSISGRELADFLFDCIEKGG